MLLVTIGRLAFTHYRHSVPITRFFSSQTQLGADDIFRVPYIVPCRFAQGGPKHDDETKWVALFKLKIASLCRPGGYPRKTTTTILTDYIHLHGPFSRVWGAMKWNTGPMNTSPTLPLGISLTIEPSGIRYGISNPIKEPPVVVVKSQLSQFILIGNRHCIHLRYDVAATIIGAQHTHFSRQMVTKKMGRVISARNRYRGRSAW